MWNLYGSSWEQMDGKKHTSKSRAKRSESTVFKYAALKTLHPCIYYCVLCTLPQPDNGLTHKWASARTLVIHLFHVFLIRTKVFVRCHRDACEVNKNQMNPGSSLSKGIHLTWLVQQDSGVLATDFLHRLRAAAVRRRCSRVRLGVRCPHLTQRCTLSAIDKSAPRLWFSLCFTLSGGLVCGAAAEAVSCIWLLPVCDAHKVISQWLKPRGTVIVSGTGIQLLDTATGAALLIDAF